MNRFKQFVIALSLVFGLTAVLPLATTYAADSAVQTACGALGSVDCSSNSGGSDLNGIVRAVINILSLIVGIAAVIMIIVGGFRYVVSNGDSNNTTSARNTILYAVIGLVIVALAQFIVQFVLKNVT